MSNTLRQETSLYDQETQPPCWDMTELADFTQPPQYALRATEVSSPQELSELIVEAAHRLSRIVPSYEHRTRHNDDSVMLLTPSVFAEGSTHGVEPIGRLWVGNAGHWSGGEVTVHEDGGEPDGRIEIASVTLEGGEMLPYISGDNSAPQLIQKLAVYRKDTIDPETGLTLSTFSAGTQARFSNDKDAFCESSPGGLAYTDDLLIQTNVLWALDKAIKYYEDVRVAAIGQSLLTYSAYRNAGCLKDDGTLDMGRCRDYVMSRSDEAQRWYGGWPILGDYDSQTVTMESSGRQSVKAYQDYLMSQSSCSLAGLVYPADSAAL
jgi:hypothetical protein